MPQQILIVEDNANIRLAMTTYLKMKGYEPLEAESIETAQAVIQAKSPAAIISDINLPDGKGDQLLHHTDVPVIAMTGHVDDATRERLLSEGFAAFLPKPATLDQLMETLDSVMKHA